MAGMQQESHQQSFADASRSTSVSTKAAESRDEETACACYRVAETEYTGERNARGVFATRGIRRGELVELAHCILIPRAQYEEHMRFTVLEHYLFRTTDGNMLLGLGAASLFNHSSSPSLDYRIDKGNLIIRFYAARDIQEGAELTFFYGRIWFEDRAQPQSQQGESTMHEHMDDERGFLAAVEL